MQTRTQNTKEKQWIKSQHEKLFLFKLVVHMLGILLQTPVMSIKMSADKSF